MTLNSLFGTGRIAPGTGIFLASLPGTGGRGATMLAPMLVTDDGTRQFYYASTASGGVAAPQALIRVAAEALLIGRPLAEAMASARIVALPESANLLVETRMSAGEAAALRQRGYTLTTVPSIAQVNAIHCAEGLRNDEGGCVAVTDPRGFGLAVTTN
ncbi:MAG: hypothetical protein HC826_02695 [Rhodospirillales bacterium]|nr:hypothetical protein [Rhodospirillales bacterium]